MDEGASPLSSALSSPRFDGPSSPCPPPERTTPENLSAIHLLEPSVSLNTTDPNSNESFEMHGGASPAATPSSVSATLRKPKPKPGALKKIEKEPKQGPLTMEPGALHVFGLTVTREGVVQGNSGPDENLPRFSPKTVDTPLTDVSHTFSATNSGDKDKDSALTDWQSAGTSSEGRPILSLNPRQKRGVRWEDVSQNGRVLGTGATGVVYKVKDALGHAYAKKVIQVDPEAASQIRAELQAVLSAHQCQNIVRSFGAFFVDGVLSIVTEYMNVGSLADVTENLLKDHIVPTEPLRCILYQTLLGLDFLHTAKSGAKTRPQIHRDIKPANILLNERGVVKLSDFGCMKQSNTTLGCANSFIGTRVYMSPERLRGDTYGVSADIWSFGVVAYECATGQAAFCQKGPFEVLQAVERPITVPPTVTPPLADLIRSCLQQDPQLRPPARSLFLCPFLKPVAEDPQKPLQNWLQGLKLGLEGRSNSNGR